MALMPFQPTPFFADKNRAFWTLQFAGWGGVLLLRAMSAFANGQPASFLAIILVFTITGFSLSLLLSPVYRLLINRRPLITWGATAVVLLVAVSLHTFVDSWVLGLYRADAETGFAQLFLGIFFFNLTLLGAWSALYYAINFFLQVEEQADRLERLEAQATSAQLAMLRYQLNPHFLFNTLNSISTLVLLKQTEPANAMLTRLSGFLRHTLMTEITGKIPLAEEVETLQLYLDIERMRFEERLRTRFEIEPAAGRALLPAMLLQPLVENAIKYAVTPQEEGARITVSARVIGNRLRVAVADTGPGAQGHGRRPLPDAVTGDRPRSTGVGLPNIRNRLAQAYGEDHRFEIRTPPEGGFTVVIEIPYEAVTAAEPGNLARPETPSETLPPQAPRSLPSPGALT